MPKFDIKKLIKAREIYKEHTRTTTYIGQYSIAQIAALKSQTVVQYIAAKLDDLVEEQKDASKKMINNKLAAQTSEGNVKDESLIKIADGSEEQLEKASTALALCYAMKEALKTDYHKEESQAAYDKAVADVKKSFNISDKQFNGFEKILNNTALKNDAYKDYVLDEDGDFEKQVSSKLDYKSQKEFNNLSKQLKSDIQLNTEDIQEREKMREAQFAKEIKDNLTFGFNITVDDIKKADTFAKNAVDAPEENGIKANSKGEFDRESYNNFFDEVINDRTNQNEKATDDCSKDMAKFVKQNIKGEFEGKKYDETFFNKMNNRLVDVRDTVIRNQREMFSLNLGKYFAAKNSWDSKSLWDIIAHPFKAYNEYKEKEQLKTDFMSKYNISKDEMAKIDKFHTKNKVEQKEEDDLDDEDREKLVEDVKDIKIKYKGNQERLNSKDEIGMFDLNEKFVKNNLVSEDYYNSLNNLKIHLSKESEEKQIDDMKTSLTKQYNNKLKLKGINQEINVESKEKEKNMDVPSANK